jgi:hypothetical protein
VTLKRYERLEALRYVPRTEVVMSWTQALNILENVIKEMRNPTDGREWLKRLEKTECKDARRLGFCIAIDVASGALGPQDYADVLNGIDANEACPRKAFGEAFAKHPKRKNLICASRLSVIGPADAEPYIRVLSLLDFITYYKKDRSLAPDDVAAIRTEYFSAYAPNDLSDIREWWSGSNGVVWVMSRIEYEDLASKYDGDELASLLNDALGLGKEPTRSDDDGRELVGVTYPPRFDGTAQPTALDALWVNFGWYYVSYGKDDSWGKTVSCSGKRQPLRERVHKEFEKLTAEYVGFPIGRILYRIIDRTALLDNADGRLESILASASS